MTIASEITRLQTAKSNIEAAIESKWVTVPDSAKLDTYNTYINQIKTTSGTPIEITGSQVYWWLYSVWKNQDVYWIDWCASYMVWDIVLIWYVWDWQTYDNYDQKDVHFIRWKKSSARKESTFDMGTWTSYTFSSQWIYITRENDWASYLFTAIARYITDWTNDWRYKWQIRYTVSTDTFTNLGSTNTSAQSNPRPDIVDDDMNLYSSSYEKSSTARTALFTLRNI